jgi:hypothetical protein
VGGRAGLTDAFLAAIFEVTGVVAAVYTVQATLRGCPGRGRLAGLRRRYMPVT